VRSVADLIPLTRGRKESASRNALPQPLKTLDGNARRTQYRSVSKLAVHVEWGVFQSCTKVRADNSIGLDAAMHFFAYSILVTAMVVVLVECGYALYHLLLLV
jgi:hypothetical protein